MKLIEALAVAIIFVAISLLAWAVQDVTVAPGPDGQYYFRLTQAFATGQPIDVESPAAYRIALPWLVALFFPTRIIEGYRILNILAVGASAFLLTAWLRAFAIRPVALRLLMVTLFLAAWCGPARFVYFYPVYVDPLFMAVLFAGLLLIYALKCRYSRFRLAVLAVLCFEGAFVRETVVLLPVALACVNNPWPFHRAHGAAPASARSRCTGDWSGTGPRHRLDTH